MNGQELGSAASVDALAKASSGAAFDSSDKVLYIKFADVNAPFEVEIDK